MSNKHAQFVYISSIVLLYASFIFIHARWVYIYRFDQLLDIDEAGYISFAIAYTKALEGGGLFEWLNSLASPNGHAPFTPTLASILMYSFGHTENTALFTNIILSTMLISVVFEFGRFISGRIAGLLCAILVATTPAVSEYTRSFHFVIPATLFFTTAAYSYVRSNSFRVGHWSIIFGASLGMMILSRTMTIAFLPAFAVAFLLHSLSSQKFGTVQVRNAVISIISFAVTALPWYYINGYIVINYLFSFGYGAHASEYGSDTGVFTVGNLSRRVDILLNSLGYSTFTIIIVCLSVSIGYSITGWLVPNDSIKRDKIATYLTLLCILCLFILATSRNIGTGFEVPVLPTLVVISVCGVLGLGKEYFSRMLIACAGISGIILAIAQIDISSCQYISKELHVHTQIGSQVFPECRGSIQKYVDEYAVMTTSTHDIGSLPVLDYEKARKWRSLSVDIANELAIHNPGKNSIVFASRHFLFNVNTTSLERIKLSGEVFPLIQIDPNVMDNSTNGYAQWLASEQLKDTCLAVLLNNNYGEFLPHPNTKNMMEALSGAGYNMLSQHSTPTSGQFVGVWKKNAPKCAEANGR